MNRLLKAARNVWIRAQLGTSPSVRRVVLPHLNDLKEVARLFARPNLPIVELSGEGTGGAITALFVNSRFATGSVKSFLFAGESSEREVGRIPFWRCSKVADSPSCDLIVIEGSLHLIRSLPSEGALVLPEFVHHTLDLSGDWTAVEARFHRGIRKRELQRVRRENYDFAVSHSDRDFDEFYRQMYVPTMHGRHGKRSRPMPRDVAYQYFSHGYLLQVRREGVWVAGTICQPEGSTIVSQITGVRNADHGLIDQGVAYVTYYFEIRCAHDRGFRAINFLGTEPFLTSGLLQHKRRWGTGVSVPAHERRHLWMKVRRLTPAVSAFLKENPLIVIDERGKLHGLIAVDDPAQVTAAMRQDWEKRYAMPGLESLIARGVSSYVESRGRDLIVPLATTATPARAW